MAASAVLKKIQGLADRYGFEAAKTIEEIASLKSMMTRKARSILSELRGARATLYDAVKVFF